MEELHRPIVVVDDNPADAEMLRMALQTADAPVEIIVFANGAQVLQYLNPGHGEAGPCELLLLDLNLPLMSGFEVLECIRSIEHLKGLPVVIMSGSKNSDEIDRCYALGANSYIAKPIHLPEILETADQLVRYWFKCAQLPALGRQGIKR